MNYLIDLPDNNTTANIIKNNPNRFIGWIFINPLKNNSFDELDKWRSVKGMIGIKIHPFWHRYSMSEVYQLGDLAEKYNYPLMIHLGFDSVEDISKFCTKFSKLTIIFSHAGFPLYQNIWPLIKISSRIFVDLSSHHVDKRIVNKAVSYLGADYCLFGTDDPYGNPKSGIWIQNWIEAMDLNKDQKEKIFSSNFNKILSQ